MPKRHLRSTGRYVLLRAQKELCSSHVHKQWKLCAHRGLTVRNGASSLNRFSLQVSRTVGLHFGADRLDRKRAAQAESDSVFDN